MWHLLDIDWNIRAMSHYLIKQIIYTHSGEQRPATRTSGWLLLGRSEVLSLRYYLLAQSHGYHAIIDRLEERGVAKEKALDDLPRTNTIKVRTISKATLRKHAHTHTCNWKPNLKTKTKKQPHPKTKISKTTTTEKKGREKNSKKKKAS